MNYDIISNNELIQGLASYKKLPKRNKCELHNTVDTYKHLTFNVSSLSDYIEIIRVLNSKEDNRYYNDSLVYRGMADYRWNLVSSLERYQGDEVAEHHLINEFLTTRPEAFQRLSSSFEVLAKMQHYGLPTRLLDFTLNPLVALYFACESLDKVDGRVVCGNAELSYTKNDIVEHVCNTYKFWCLDNIMFDQYLDNSRITQRQYLSSIYLCKDNRLLFAKPKYWNQRIINQSAVFLIFPNALCDRLGEIAYYQQFYGLENTSGFDDTPYMREQISAILEVEGNDIYPIVGYNHKNIPHINPMLTHNTATKIFEKYESQPIVDNNYQYIGKAKLCLSNRFVMDSIDFNPVDEDTLENLLCSIIINKKYKKAILNELATIGIDQAFIYPELEYTARKIATDYLKRLENDSDNPDIF